MLSVDNKRVENTQMHLWTPKIPTPKSLKADRLDWLHFEKLCPNFSQQKIIKYWISLNHVFFNNTHMG